MVASIFDFVAWHWPCSSISSVRTESSQSLEDGYEDGTMGQHLEMMLGGDDEEFTGDTIVEPDLPDPEPIMALPVDPPRDSQILEDTFVANSPVPPVEEEIFDDTDKEPQPCQVLSEEPVPVASPVGSSSVAPTEIEVTPSPAPKHTAENTKEDNEVIEVVESPVAHKDLNLDEVQAKIDALKCLSLSSFEFCSFLLGYVWVICLGLIRYIVYCGCPFLSLVSFF